MHIDAGGIVVSNQASQLSTFQVCQSPGPSFDLTLMPEFADLIPGAEPVNLTLALRVGVTDPDGVSGVIGSYKNGSSSIWTNISMSSDISTSNPDDYVAWPHNYTISEPSFVVIWDIKFYANDSLNNWNTSSLHRISICRQGSTGTITTSQFSPLYLPIAIVVTFAAIMLPILYVMYRRKENH